MPQLRLRSLSRLHVGIFSDHRPGGRCFQGMGMMIDEPGFEIEFSNNVSETSISGISDWLEPARNYLERYQATFKQPVKIIIHQGIPPHTGLGSGTQFAYLMLHGLQLLAGIDQPDVQSFRSLSQRGKRSSIGSYGYFTGGFLVDRGHLPGSPEGLSPLRYELPEEWRILLIEPQDTLGLHGLREQEAFNQWPRFSIDVLDRLLSLTYEIVPQAVNSADFKLFSKSLTEFGQLVGQSFAPFQGGTFSCSQANQIEEVIQQAGYPGLLQSSWGPSLCLFVEDQRHGEELLERLKSSGVSAECKLKLVRIDHHGVRQFAADL